MLNNGALATVTDSATGRTTTYYYDFTDRMMKYVESGSGYNHSVGYTYDNTTIQFKKTTNKEVSKLSYKTALTVQALKALGKDKIDDIIITRLSKLLTAEEKKTMLEEAKAATSWIYEYIKLICRN